MAINNSINNRSAFLVVQNDSGYGTKIEGEKISSLPQGAGADIKIIADGSSITIPSTDVNYCSYIAVQTWNPGGDCMLIVKTDNVTDGKAYYELGTTTTTWTMGSKIKTGTTTEFLVSPSATLGTNNVMEIQETGEVNFPNQPSFLAFVNGTILNVTGNNTNYTVLFDSTVYNEGSDYNTANGTFTASVTGKFHFCFSVLVGGIVASSDGGLGIVTSNRTYKLGQCSPSAVKDSSGQACFRGEVFTDMDALDTIRIDFKANGEGADVNDVIGHATNLVSYFSGRLVC